MNEVKKKRTLVTSFQPAGNESAGIVLVLSAVLNVSCINVPLPPVMLHLQCLHSPIIYERS